VNPAIADIVRDPGCAACMMARDAYKVCITGRGPKRAKIMVVSKQPDSKRYREELESYLTDVGLETKMIFFSSAIKCRNWERNPSNADIKTCKDYLDKEIKVVEPAWVLALGNEALLATAGKSGITKYRGQVIEKDGYKIIPTISPSAVNRNPGFMGGFLADLHFFASQVEGRDIGISEPEIRQVDKKHHLQRLMSLLRAAEEVVYDVETTGDGEWVPTAKVVSLSLTIKLPNQEEPYTYFVPLYHPESPWRKVWRRVLHYLCVLIKRVPKRIGHNGKYDDKWNWAFGGVELRYTFDTLLAAHVLDENRPKGLKPLAQTILGVRPWGISTKDLLNEPLDKIRVYNGKDTYYTWHLYRVFREQLKENPRARKIFTILLMPAARVYVRSERRGVWVDREELATNAKIAEDMLADVESRLMAHVPADPYDQFPSTVFEGQDDPWRSEEELADIGWPTIGKKGKLAPINFNASKWARWWLFDYLDLPVLERGKDKSDGSAGDPSMREGVLMELKDRHPAVPIMLERVEWNKMVTSFFNPYQEIIDDQDRIHTVFKLHGTVTGRTSSGKEDQEKITASKGKRRGVNLQQVPRNKLVRGVFGAPPDHYFVEADFSQIELRIAAFLARERMMISLYQQGADIHTTTASKVTGIPESQVPPKVRKEVGKPTNFGFLYGMSWAKFIKTAFETYGVVFTEEEAKAFRKAYFDLFPDLLVWHNRQRRMVRKYGRVESPLGRVRHLPDIYSPDKGVAAEAERQAINSPVQSMASDMCLLSMVIIDKKFERLRMPVHVIGTVHDAVNFEIHRSCMAEALPIIKHTMENLPLERLFDVNLDVPIESDLKVGKHWGGATELSSDQVFNWDPSLIAV
jgi:uracil-DNA glycosylase family 4